MHRRSGHELGNHRTGAVIDLKASVKAKASAESSQQLNKQTGTTSSSQPTASDTASAMYDLANAPSPIGERYVQGNWNPSSGLRGDASFEELRKLIEAQAALSAKTRADRENQLRDVSRKQQALVAAYVPWGTIAAASLWAFTEGAIALGKVLTPSDRDSPAQIERATNAVKQIWKDWLLLPPPYYPELESAQAYADYCEGILKILQTSEDDSPWREEWLKTMAATIDSEIPAARDVSFLGWIPLDIRKWLGQGYYDGRFWYTSYRVKDMWFDQVRTVHHKPGFLSAEKEYSEVFETPSYEAMAHRMDPMAAGVGVAVAVRYNVQIEPVMEAAVNASRHVLHDIGPLDVYAGLRLRYTFQKAVEAALAAPKNPMLIRRSVADPRLEVLAKAIKDRKEVLVLKPNAVLLLSQALKPVSIVVRGFRKMKASYLLGSVKKAVKP